MLFNYRYVNHDIEKFQVWLDHLVKKVWCRNGGEYSLSLLHPDLKAVVEEIANDDSLTKDHLDGPIKIIDAIFQDQLDSDQRDQVSQWYDHNNDIEALCGNEPQKMPGTYAEIKSLNNNLESELKKFCKSLFQDIIHLKAVTSRTAEIDAHYKAFVTANDEGKCPYCGYNDIKGQHHNKREAYDHFLPKGTYPFNSVNFKNLAPMCHECNSSFKLQKNPLRHIDPIHKATGGRRRKAFFSFANVAPSITINMTIASAEVDKLIPSDITLTVSSPGRDEELESWMDVFGIEERYKAKICAKNDGKYWLVQAVDECANGRMTPQEIIDKIEQNANSNPWAEVNFLKRPFLKACKEAGVLP
ncbi:conserved hypothetical protein [Pirellula staleyi DSM 6068]|uniref:C2H2-type domain-containing protein n=1 Tax=Pirellula staleyi (strain ATCC 27377 / DSM 6068 / ICPB 4128) TaxID=530564 RepID=D2R5Z9_PIRSD|nr:hypothetical protein [Pirellula staleyi]ADB19084.1 conserved hypothetical protein [Pirellula staleyi DSM 6068]